MRFGYEAERAAGFGLGVAWVPLGITYSAKERCRSDVLIRIGAPFRLRGLHEDPAAHEAEVLERGAARLQIALQDLVVHIDGEDLAGLVDRLTDLLGSPERPLAPKLDRARRVARALQYYNEVEPGRIAALEEALGRYDARLSAAGLSDDVVRQRHPALRLWVSLRGIVAHGTLLVLNRYGRANSLLPRWSSWMLGRVGHRLGRTPSPGGGPGSPRVEEALPSWRLYVQRRDLFRAHLARLADAYRFLRHAAPARRLQADRRRLVGRLRALLLAYEAAGPPAA